MGYYEPQWSDEEQTMVDLMKLAGYGVVPHLHRDYSIVQLFEPNSQRPLTFRDDTEYGVIRKAFSFWTNHNAKN
jgi:hypothetical protein